MKKTNHATENVLPPNKADGDTQGTNSINLDHQNLFDEVNALVNHIIGHGNLLSDEDKPLYYDLRRAVDRVSEDPSSKAWSNLKDSYTDITTITRKSHGINGRTILDSKESIETGWWSKKKIHPLLRSVRRYGVMLFSLAMIFELLTHWARGLSGTESLNLFQSALYFVAVGLSNLLLPALWGGLGACVFLNKQIFDKLSSYTFMETQMRGFRTHIFLGSMMGVASVAVIFPDFNERISIGVASIGPAILALISGLGAKPIYAVFESFGTRLARLLGGKSQMEATASTEGSSMKTTSTERPSKETRSRSKKGLKRLWRRFF